jgi:phospholipid/cholesterol/gamma-HCH transport system permease protein
MSGSSFRESEHYSQQSSNRLSLWVTDCGALVIEAISTVGDIAIFSKQIFCWMLSQRPAKGTLLRSCYQVGVLSLPVVALTGTFIGMVLAVQSYRQFEVIGLENRLGAVINSSLVRELGPVLAATMLAGRIGGSIAAMLGTMRVTEQIEALSAMGADPIHYLVVPRFLACVALIPALTLIADFMGIVGGYFYSVVVLGIDHAAYLQNSADHVTWFDLFSGLLKSLFFGAIIAIISCYRGFNCSSGAEGVGQAATLSFVMSFVLILGTDLILNILLDSFYYSIWKSSSI